MSATENSIVRRKKEASILLNRLSKMIERERTPDAYKALPAEPNGTCTLHAKAICIDFGIAQNYGGICKPSLDDTTL